MTECEAVLYMIRAACPYCETVVGHVEERDAPVGLMQAVEVSAEFCPRCGRHVPSSGAEWDVCEDAEVERVEPTDPAEVDR